MPTLTSLLARDAIVSLDVVEQALQRQVLEGGEIDTALLELAAVPENVLAAYRAASFDLPPASRAQLERIDPQLIARVPAKLAREFRAVPITLERDLLVLAVDAPLQPIESQRLSTALEARLSFRIVTELRASAALHAHYGVELPQRLRVLEQRLRDVSPGELCEVRQSTPSREPIAFRHRVSARPPADSSMRVSREGGIAEAVRRVSNSLPPPPQSRTGASSTAVASVLAAESAPLPDTRQMPRPPNTSRSTAKAQSVQRVPRGPFTWQQAVELLGEAQDRDRVLDIFFSFARQFFDCSVLFVVREERLYPFRSAGLPADADEDGISLRQLSGGSVFAATQTLAARVADLRGHSSDAALLGAIGRARFQPCALVPVAIRKRMIGLLYGDRAGEALELSEFSDVLPLVSNVGTALERIIQERKRNAAEGRAEPSAVAEVSTRAAPPPAPPPIITASPSFRHVTTVAPPRITTQEFEAVKPAPNPEPTPNPVPAPTSGPNSTTTPDLALQPTIELPTGPIERGRSQTPPPRAQSLTPPLPRPGSYSERDAGEERVRTERREMAKTMPQRPSRLQDPNRPSIGRMSLVPPPRTLAQAPAGSGSYSMRPARAPESTQPDLDLDLDPTDRPPPMPESRGHEDATAVAVAPRAAVPAAAAAAGMAATSSAANPAVTASKELPTIMVAQPSAEAERLADELMNCTPDQGQDTIVALQKLGLDGLRALQRRFPGPLWFDRNKPRHRIPSGHDISAIARGVRAFEDGAVPVLAELMALPQVDARLCALLLAAERPRSQLIWPLYQRLFDTDGQVRVMALEVLPRFRSLPEFAEVLRLLRERAGDEREAIPSRLSALEAIGALRDAASVELLLKLCRHGSRQLSVPAHRSLLLITAQDFGDSERKWKGWLEKNRKRPRVEWLIESLMHGDERVRNTAGLELQKLTQVYYGFVASSPKRDRERAQQRYRDWLRQQGKVPTLA